MSNSDTAVLEETKGCAALPSDLPFMGHCNKGVFPRDFHHHTGLGQLHGISLGCPGMHNHERINSPDRRDALGLCKMGLGSRTPPLWDIGSLVPQSLAAPTRRERILPIKLTKQRAIKLHHIRELPEMPQKAVISLATVCSLISPFPRYRNCCSFIRKALEIPTHNSKRGTMGNFATAVAEL